MVKHVKSTPKIGDQKCISPWAYIRERFSGSEIQNLKKFAYKPMGLYAGKRIRIKFKRIKRNTLFYKNT